MEVKSFQIACPYCAAQLVVVQSDITYHEFAQPEFEVVCGNCCKKIPLERQSLPSSWITPLVGNESGH